MEEARLKEILDEAGINYAKGLDRFMGNRALYEKFLVKFLYDGSHEEFNMALSSGDMAMAEKAIHTLKGTAGNLSMETLYQDADAAVKAIRAKADTPEIMELAKKVDDSYERVCAAAKKIQEG